MTLLRITLLRMTFAYNAFCLQCLLLTMPFAYNAFCLQCLLLKMPFAKNAFCLQCLLLTMPLAFNAFAYSVFFLERFCLKFHCLECLCLDCLSQKRLFSECLLPSIPLLRMSLLQMPLVGMHCLECPLIPNFKVFADFPQFSTKLFQSLKFWFCFKSFWITNNLMLCLSSILQLINPALLAVIRMSSASDKHPSLFAMDICKDEKFFFKLKLQVEFFKYTFELSKSCIIQKMAPQH
jgi:hypothetical protein